MSLNTNGKSNPCKGCGVRKKCNLSEYNRIMDKCPCSKCLIKSVCAETCEDFDDFVQNQDDWWRDENGEISYG